MISDIKLHVYAGMSTRVEIMCSPLHWFSGTKQRVMEKVNQHLGFLPRTYYQIKYLRDMLTSAIVQSPSPRSWQLCRSILSDTKHWLECCRYWTAIHCGDDRHIELHIARERMSVNVCVISDMQRVLPTLNVVPIYLIIRQITFYRSQH